MAEIKLDSVSKSFGKQVALHDLSLTIAEGGFVILLGPTGAGKTTTLRLIAGLEKPDSGSISIAGHDVAAYTPAQRNVAMVFQQYSLYPHLSVRDNLAFPLKSPTINLAPQLIAQKVGEVAELLRISHKLDNKATELSGGEMQRVSIGRALVRKPSIYLLDEPLSSLDAKLRAELRVELKRIQVDMGATMLYVTHDQAEAMTMATRIGVLNQGELVQFGSAREVYADPNSIYVATRLGQPRINIVPAALFGGANIPEGATQLGLRPEHIAITTGSASHSASVKRIERLGDQTRLHLQAQGHDLVSLAEAHTSLQPGAAIRISFNAALYFDAAGNRVRT